jgi:hypothetical protein
MIGRRNFVLGTALVAAARAFAGVLSLSSSRQSPSLPHADGLQSSPGPKAQDANAVVFGVRGWTPCPTIPHDVLTGSGADHASNDAVGDQVWISISQSWKTAWR